MRILICKIKEKLWWFFISPRKSKSSSVGNRKVEVMFLVFWNWHSFPEIWWIFRNVYVSSFKDNYTTYWMMGKWWVFGIQYGSGGEFHFWGVTNHDKNWTLPQYTPISDRGRWGWKKLKKWGFPCDIFK